MLARNIQTNSTAMYDDLVQVSAGLYKKALTDLPPDVRSAVNRVSEVEVGGARTRLDVMVKSIDVSDRTGIIVCQDTGICVYFVKLGTEFPINGAKLIDALRRGIAVATKEHNLRSSVVHPITRENRQDNTGVGIPDVHIEFVDGSDELEILLVPKGSGSENMSYLKMLSPAEGISGVKRFVLDSVIDAGPRPCPPTVVGVGIGGTADLCAGLAKRAILRPVGEPHPEPEVAAMEQKLLAAINETGIGPQGLGGSVTSFAVHVEYAATHISMNPVAVNIQCWRGERASATISRDGAVSYGD
jgi:tartrate/fumarate subfamily iron-sulfur-dependent hydro-lyase alpha chain